MKNISVFCFLLVVSVSLFGQQITPVPTIQTDYLKKSKNQRTAGIVLMSGGGAVLLAGAITFMGGFTELFDWSGGSDLGESKMNTGGILMATGGVIVCSGIPFMVAAHKYKKKAKSLSGHVMVVPKTPMNKMFALGVKINF